MWSDLAERQMRRAALYIYIRLGGGGGGQILMMMKTIAGGEWSSSVRPPEPLSLTTSQVHGRSKEDQERVVDTMRSCENWSCKTNIITQWTYVNDRRSREVWQLKARQKQVG